MKLCVIPARGGSKRIPRKNIRPFAGKPMLAYAINAAHASGLFDTVLVSSEDQEILLLAELLGAVPLIRPRELADDYTGTVPVIAHAIEACRGIGGAPELACCIYPAVPLLKTEDLVNGFQLLQEVKADYVLPVTPYPSAIQRAFRLDASGKISSFYPEYETARTQDLEPAYHDAGQFYWGRVEAWMSGKNIHRHGYGMIIPGWRVVDIDTPDDWRRAELIYRALSEQEQ